MIVLEGLQKKFGKQHILQDVSYTFQTGSKTVILGSNGSGKSTLIKILSGALEATEGSPVYTFEGSNVTAKSAYSSNSNPNLLNIDNILYSKNNILLK